MRNVVFKSVSPIISRGTGICDRSALLDITNEAQERLLNRKDAPVGALVPYRFWVQMQILPETAGHNYSRGKLLTKFGRYSQPPFIIELTLKGVYRGHWYLKLIC